jgi:hypothetical protein
MEIINLNKKVFNKNQYEKVINTKFSQLATTITPAELEAQNNSTLSVEQFFQDYQQLFLQIPKEGNTNSHEYLVKTSSEYIDFTPTDDSIQALIDEINLLQQTNLELNQQIVNLQISSSKT